MGYASQNRYRNVSGCRRDDSNNTNTTTTNNNNNNNTADSALCGFVEPGK
jgi:hypothetical protein